jgi:hypothetical protein
MSSLSEFAVPRSLADVSADVRNANVRKSGRRLSLASAETGFKVVGTWLDGLKEASEPPEEEREREERKWQRSQRGLGASKFPPKGNARERREI